MKIGIVVGSIREGRKGLSVAEWVQQRAAKRPDADYLLVDLKSFDVPLLTASTLPMAAQGHYDNPEVTRWSQAISACDGFVFVTPEYNHGVPGAFKNAVDSLGVEWVGKAVAFVSYGADSGVRAVEQWRQIVANFSMVDVRAQLACSVFTEFGDGDFTPLERRENEIVAVFDQIEAQTRRQRS